MKRSRKGIFSFICVLMVLAVTLSACGGGTGATNQGNGQASGNQTTGGKDGSDKKIELTMWQMWGTGHEKEVLDKYIAEYEKANPNVKITETNVTDFAKILTSISAGSPPDILDMWEGSAIAEWAAQNALTPLDDYIAKDKIDKDAFLPSSWDVVTYNAKVYAMPFVAFNSGFLWNKQMFKAAGLDPEKPPKTFDEVIQYSEAITKTDGSGKILQMGFVPNWPTSNLQKGLIWLAGGDMYNEAENKITANDPGVIKALEWERKFFEKYGAQNVQNFISSGGQYLTAQDLFESGKLAMCIDGPWVIRFIQDNIPELAKDIGAAYIPAASDRPDLYGTSFIDVNPQIIPAGAAHPDEAWKFIKWLTTDKDIASAFADLVANIPHLKGAPTTKLLEDPRFALFIEMASSTKARVLPRIAVGNEYGVKLSDIENRVLLDPKLDMKALLDDLNDEMNAALQKAGK